MYCKIAWAGFHCIAKLRVPIPRVATTIIFPWQTVLKCSADCQPPLSGPRRTMQSAKNPPRSAMTGLGIGARNLAIE
jgi:hypothetical protein